MLLFPAPNFGEVQNKICPAASSASQKGTRTVSNERRGWKIPEWGQLYNLGRAKSYQLIKDGQGPRTIKVGGVEIVTNEADAEWRQRKQAEAAERAKQGAA
jgi:predicted DNA-binding transcriptional regulator AlpA